MVTEVECSICGGKMWKDKEGVIHREFKKEMTPYGSWKEHDCPILKRPSEVLR